ncbi:SSD domain-containing protein [Plasmodiophora brassicae]
MSSSAALPTKAIRVRPWSERHLPPEQQDIARRPSPAPSDRCDPLPAPSKLNGAASSSNPIQPGPISRFVSRRPCASVALSLFVPLLSLVYIAYTHFLVSPLYLDLNIIDYSMPEYSDGFNALMSASPLTYSYQRTQYLSSHAFSPLSDSTRTYTSLPLVLVFVSTSGDLLNSDDIATIRQVEQTLLANPIWKSICMLDGQECQQPQSFTRIVYPSFARGGVEYDGRGSIEQPVPISTQIALSLNLYQLFDRFITPKTPRSRTLLSNFNAGMPLPGYTDINDRVSQQADAIRAAMNELIPFLSGLSTPRIQVLFTGGDILLTQVYQAVWHDVLLVMASFLFAFACMWVIMASLWLAFVGIAAIAIVFITTIAVYLVIYGTTFSLLALTSLWIVLGVMCDHIFKFHDLWHQAPYNTSTERLAWTFTHARNCMFATSATTAIGHFSNSFSSIDIIRQFGGFLGFSVLIAFVVASTFVPACIVWHGKRYPSRQDNDIHVVDDGDGVVVKRRHRWMRAFARFTGRHRFLIAAVFLGGTAWFAYLCTGLTTPSSMPQVMPNGSNFQRLQLAYEQDLPSCDSCQFMLSQATSPTTSAPSAAVAPSGPTNASAGAAQTSKPTQAPAPAAGVVATKRATSAKPACSLSCGTNGVCTTGVSSQFCKCNPGYAGLNCEATCGPCGAGSCRFSNPWASTTVASLSPTCSSLYNQCTSSTTSISSCMSYVQNGCPVANLCQLAWKYCVDNGIAEGCSYLRTLSCAYAPTSVNATCACGDGAFGAHCNVTCPGYSPHQAPCSGRGKCVPVSDPHTGTVASASCICPPGRTGYMCEIGGSAPATSSISQTAPPGATMAPVVAAADAVPTQKAVTVYVVWGVEPTPNWAASKTRDSEKTLAAPIWDPNFNLSSPAMQSHIVTTCQMLRQWPAMVRPSFTCIGEDWRDYQVAQHGNGSFPIRSSSSTLTSQLVAFLESGAGSNYQDDVGIDVSTGRVLFLRIPVVTLIDTSLSGSALMGYYGQWNAFTDRVNAAGSGAVAKAYQTSSRWNLMGMETALVTGTLYSVVFTVAACTLSLIALTRSVRIVLISMVTQVMVFVCIGACIVLLGWKVGVVELVSLSMLIGVALDFQLHIASAYQDSKGADAHARLIRGMTMAGCGVLWSTLATFGSTLILAFCDVQIFVEFGVVVALTAKIGFLYAIGFFPATLFIVLPGSSSRKLAPGPTGDQFSAA